MSGELRFAPPAAALANPLFDRHASAHRGGRKERKKQQSPSREHHKELDICFTSLSLTTEMMSTQSSSGHAHAKGSHHKRRHRHAERPKFAEKEPALLHNLKRGTIDEVLDYITGDADEPTIGYFLVTFRFFISPRELLLRLIRKCKNNSVPAAASPEIASQWEEWLAPLRQKVGMVLKGWLSMHFYDFEEDDVLIRSLISFIDTEMGDSDLANDLRLLIQDKSEKCILSVLGPQSSFDVISAALKKSGLPQDHYAGKRKYKLSVYGKDVVEWLERELELDQQDAICIGRELLAENFISPVDPNTSGVDFRADSSLYYVRYEPAEIEAMTCPEPIWMPANTSKIGFLDLHAREVARQLTLVCHSIFKETSMREFREGAAFPHGKKLPTTPHLNALYEIYQKVTYWVATEVLTMRDFQLRAKVLQKFIHVARKLRMLQNYHCLMAVINALQKPSIQRLTRTWRALPPPFAEQFKELVDLMSPEEDYLNYRLEQMKLRSPVMPYLVPLLLDIAFVEKSGPDFFDAEKRTINFEKMRLIGRTLVLLRNMQVYNYRLQALPQIQEYFSKAIVIDNESALLEMSLTCERSDDI